MGVGSQTEPSGRPMYIRIMAMAGVPAVIYYAVYKHLSIGHLMVRLNAESPYLIHDHSKAPHVTGSGVLPVTESLRGCPLHWNFSSMRDIVVSFLENP